MVVDARQLLDHFGGLRHASGTSQEELALEDAVDLLGQRVLISVVSVRHRTAD